MSEHEPERLLVGVGRLRGATVVCTGTVMLDMTALLLGRCLGATDVPSFAKSDHVCLPGSCINVNTTQVLILCCFVQDPPLRTVQCATPWQTYSTALVYFSGKCSATMQLMHEDFVSLGYLQSQEN